MALRQSLSHRLSVLMIFLPVHLDGQVSVNFLVTVFLHGLPYGSAQYGIGYNQITESYAPNFNPTMTKVMIAVIVSFFVLGIVLLYLQLCVWRTRPPQTTQRPVGAGAPRRAAVGLDTETVEKFPTFAYSSVKGLKIVKDALECAVCLNEFEEHEILRLIPRCCHVFHKECVDTWLSDHTTCPVCRTNLQPEPDKPVSSQAPETTSNLSADQGVGGSNRTFLDPPESNLLNTASAWGSRNWPRRSKSTRMPRRQANEIYLRSNSAGHASSLQPDEISERFTLRLPENVRHALAISSSDQTKSNMALPGVSSPREGYRRSGADRETNRFDRCPRAFSLTSLALARTHRDRNEYTGLDDAGERSSDRPRPGDYQV